MSGRINCDICELGYDGRGDIQIVAGSFFVCGVCLAYYNEAEVNDKLGIPAGRTPTKAYRRHSASINPWSDV